jgi:hypothetical protein
MIGRTPFQLERVDRVGEAPLYVASALGYHGIGETQAAAIADLRGKLARPGGGGCMPVTK